MPSSSSDVIFHTPILRKRWYEVGVLSVRMSKPLNKSINASLKSFDNNLTMDEGENQYRDTCIKLNQEKSIVDSGTTNIRLPDSIFREAST